MIKIEVNEFYDLSNLINDDVKVTVENENILLFDKKIIKGLKTGKTTIFFNDKSIEVNVIKQNSLKNDFTLSYGYLSNKNLLILGDSVSAQATIGDGKTYSTLLKEKLNINTLLNAAIGGTTLTYMYEGSNIDKEYHSNEVALDGCRVVKKLEDENKLSNFDYVIIAYGHNDQYFKPSIDEENTIVKSLNDCHSFKNSFRFIINTLMKNNPNVRITILNCTYSEYDKADPSKYHGNVFYIDYRKAA